MGYIAQGRVRRHRMPAADLSPDADLAGAGQPALIADG